MKKKRHLWQQNVATKSIFLKKFLGNINLVVAKTGERLQRLISQLSGKILILVRRFVVAFVTMLAATYVASIAAKLDLKCMLWKPFVAVINASNCFEFCCN